jgi:Uma2 family endonuclease
MSKVDVLPVVVPADHVAGPGQGRWTYTEYAALPDDGQRYEVIDGVLYMTPAPNLGHQGGIARFVYYFMAEVELAGLGRVFPAPTDVELAPNTVVQPDIVVILNANASILAGMRVLGAPDLVVEIASPSTAGYDRRQKQNAYARAGVWEYWVADPLARTIELLQLSGGAYVSAGVFQGQAQLPTQVLAGLRVAAGQFFV